MAISFSVPASKNNLVAARNRFQHREYCILPGMFNSEECAELLAWSRYSFRNNDFWNFAANPDKHRLLRRINETVTGLFGKRYRFLQTAIHASRSSRPLLHSIHIDAVVKFFQYSRDSNVQVWILLQAEELGSNDTHLHLWSGFVPDESKKVDENAYLRLNPHQICDLSPGDVVILNAWCPHATGIIDHRHERVALKIHYVAEDAKLDRQYLRRNRLLPWTMVMKNTHGGIEPLLFYLERFGGSVLRRLLAPPLIMLRTLRMLLPDRRWRAFGPGLVETSREADEI